ncbi:unnamed protein product [Brassica rapa]|uniref:S-protein homolog n=1 Tax=Brassica campestris TaxID=3711 RepID=A0A8D9HP28_BRACM|nr:unnamed protein product [Brassica rapa]
MAFSNKPHCILIFMISFFIFTLFVSALDVSDVVAEAPAPGPGSGGDSFFPLSKKHVIIHNVVKNRQTLNVHCKSADDDLGLIHIPWNHYWGFRFRVNIWSTTMFRCHFTWYGGGSHLFVIFDPWRDDDEFAKYPACDKCLWQVRRQDGDEAICRIGARGTDPYCFPWLDNCLCNGQSLLGDVNLANLELIIPSTGPSKTLLRTEGMLVALEVSDAVADAPGPGSGGDGFIPLAKKHVVIRNVVQNRQTHECTLQI